MNSIRIGLRSVLVAVTLMMASTGAHAISSVTFNGVLNSVNRNGFSSGFYDLTIDSTAILGLCDSVDAVVNPPVTWTADILTYADIQAGGVGRYNNPSTAATLTKYSQAGWLFGQIAAQGPANYAAQADIQEAIWKIMVPGYAVDGSGNGAFWHALATGGAYDAFDWSAVMRVVTANPLVVDGREVQEFLIGPGVSVVPVPAAVWLFGSALGLLGLSRRRSS